MRREGFTKVYVGTALSLYHWHWQLAGRVIIEHNFTYIVAVVLLRDLEQLRVISLVLLDLLHDVH